jgi:hypothetical protein
MNQVAEGGGPDDLVVDHGTLEQVVSGLADAAEALDGSGASAPAGGDYGDAAALVATMLAAVAEAGARIAFEATTLSSVVGECNSAAATADRDAAASYLVRGAP